MALSATKEAIGEVTDFLRIRLANETSVNVVIGRPEVAAASDGPKFNLFLFQVEFDGQLKNHSLDRGQAPPLWLVLRYLLTAFDEARDSDSIAAHRMLGEGLAVLHSLNFVHPSTAALLSNPEPLKITFDVADTELLSKVMQGTDEKYRVSSAFQVRPVLIVPDSEPAYAPAVLTVGPPASPGVVVLPTMGPHLLRVTPERFEVGATVSLAGTEINTTIEEVHFGPASLPVIAAKDGEVRTRIEVPAVMSAGSYPISVARVLPSGRRLSSNPLVATLLPTLTNVALGPLTAAGSGLFGSITLTGQRLGGPDDLILVAFYRDGDVVLTLEVTGTSAQTSLVVQVTAAEALIPGTYYLIVRVNGAQATSTPRVDWV